MSLKSGKDHGRGRTTLSDTLNKLPRITANDHNLHRVLNAERSFAWDRSANLPHKRQSLRPILLAALVHTYVDEASQKTEASPTTIRIRKPRQLMYVPQRTFSDLRLLYLCPLNYPILASKDTLAVLDRYCTLRPGFCAR